MPAREPLICPNWCPFVQGDILSQIWSLHSAAAHVSSTIYNLVILFEQGQIFALQRHVWFYLGKKITTKCRHVWVELSFAISLVCSVIITFFMGFMTSFNPVCSRITFFIAFMSKPISIPHVISTSFKDSLSLFSKGVPLNNKSQAKIFCVWLITNRIFWW